MYFATTSTVDQGLIKGSVLESKPTSTWIVYTDDDWCHNPKSSGKAAVIQVKDGVVDAGGEIKSIQGFDNNNPSIFVLEHFDFKGFGAHFLYSQPNLSFFPAGTVAGASSAIIAGGEWSFHTDYNYGGIQISVKGETKFGPGTVNFRDNPPADNLAKSLLRVK